LWALGGDAGAACERVETGGAGRSVAKIGGNTAKIRQIPIVLCDCKIILERSRIKKNEDKNI
jgi:hypothetical protein